MTAAGAEALLPPSAVSSRGCCVTTDFICYIEYFNISFSTGAATSLNYVHGKSQVNMVMSSSDNFPELLCMMK